MLDDLGAGGRLGVEFDSYGLTHFQGRRLEAALAGRATLLDASRLVPGLRVTKSAEELVHVREAARLSDLADRAAIEATRAGADEGEILAAMHHAIFAGRRRLSRQRIHHRLGRRRAALPLQERSAPAWRPTTSSRWNSPGVSRHYHAAIMRTHVVGREKPLHRAYHAAAREALEACAAELRPGRTAGDVFAAHARVLDAHGLARASAECLRLFARRQIHAVLDGRADVLRGQSRSNSPPTRSISCT